MDRRDIDPDRAELAPLGDLVALWMASNPEELWRAIVVHGGGSTTDHWLAVRLFRRHHEDGAPGALTTALLLCTDRRWDRCTGRLIAGIVDTAVLDVEDLGKLASCFLWSDRFRFEYPVSWIGTEWLRIDLEGGKGAVGPSVMHLDPATPVPTERSIRPPLRRWAASRVLCADPSTFEAIQARAKELGPLDGGAVVSGVLDAIEVLDQHVGRRAIHLGLGWARGSVRLLALDRLAAIDPEDARRRAATDPDLKVRKWTTGQAPVASVVAGKESAGQDTRRGGRAPRAGQAELFPE